MSLPFGVTVAGFLAKDLDTIRTELREAFVRALGAVNVEASPIHQLIELYANRERTLWELAESVYAASDPDSASGAALDALGALTGTPRDPATSSTVTLSVTLEATTTLPAGSVASVTGNPTARFVTLAEVTSTTAGVYEVLAESEDTGPVAGLAGTITEIATPVSGWTAVTNALDAVPGTDLETDTSYRARREDELAAVGTGTADAMRAELLAVDGIVAAYVFENATDLPYVLGPVTLSPHSLAALVYDGTDDGSAVTADTIAQAIWDAKPVGIETAGTETGTAVDASGVSHTIRFTRPTPAPVYIDAIVDVSILDGWDATTGEDEIKAAIVAFAEEAFGIGDDVILTRLYRPIYSVAGVVDAAIEMGFAAAPSGTSNLSISPGGLATFDTSRITVIVTLT